MTYGLDMNNATNLVMAEAETVDGAYLMSRGLRDTVLVSREYAWADIKEWQKNPRMKWIRVTRGGEVVWSWAAN